ncbi:hypothetical protein [Bartonella raoultii]|nr:hypothetical protein [Bartonella raoultii]
MGKIKEKQALCDKELGAFSLTEAFLSRRDYKRIFYISLLFVILKGAFSVIDILIEWKLLEFENDTISIVLMILSRFLQFITLFIILLIPIAVGCRIIFTHLLKKKIKKLEEVTQKRDNIIRLREKTSKGC